MSRNQVVNLLDPKIMQFDVFVLQEGFVLCKSGWVVVWDCSYIEIYSAIFGSLKTSCNIELVILSNWLSSIT